MRDECHDDPIDAVVTWVDGNQPAHRALREFYMAQLKGPLGANASNPHRWNSDDEIYYCLRSIVAHAPWVRTIWLVVDGTTPDLSRLPERVRERLQIIHHLEIFTGFEHLLPTFNSLAIESVLWRIDGLAERFLYFNDDVFLTAPLAPGDLFEGNKPVLRGNWLDMRDLARTPAARDDPASFHGFMQINAAALAGQDAARVFAPAHVVHPMRRSVMARLFAQYRAAFVANIRHRFRDLEQFLPQGLHNHVLIAEGAAVLADARDHLHIRSGEGSGGSAEAARALLGPEALSSVKFLCVNDLGQLEAILPEARALIARAIGVSLDA